MANNDVIKGSEFDYRIDTSYGLSSDGYIATGTESIVYKGIKISRYEKIRLSCVLKFKYKSIRVGTNENELRSIDVYEKFRSKDLRIFDALQDCRSVVRIFDVIEDLGSFSVTDTHVAEGRKSIAINRDKFFCVVEEYVDGWSLEEYCRDEYWKLTETVDVGNDLKKKVPFHQFPIEKQEAMKKSYHRDYNELIRYQSEILNFMLNLCEILKYITDKKKILHLDIKPDNIMVTRHGKELVLIDFGRSEYLDSDTNSVMSSLGQTNYNQEQTYERMSQYGTLGYAAPECYAAPTSDSKFPFDDTGIVKGKMSVESDIFSFGATFWECLSIFELYTEYKDFATDKNQGGSYEFYRRFILSDAAYCDRDLSLTSSHYHEKLETIIKKCTRKREPGYQNRDNPLYYHDYDQLQQDIQIAKESAPALVKTENVKVRNAFGVSGVMAGLIGTVLLVCGFLKLTGSYFAERKMDSIMNNYNPTLIERLEDAAIEQMESATETEKHDIYNKTYDFLENQDNNLEYSETVVLVDLLKEINNSDFVGNAVDEMFFCVDQKGFSSCIKYTVVNLPECDSVGYQLAVQIYNAQKRMDLSECYSVLQSNAENSKYAKLVERLAQDLNHDELITIIAEEQLSEESEQTSETNSKDTDRLAEIKNEVKTVLDSITEGSAYETNE